MRSSPEDTSGTGGSARSEKNHIAIVGTVKQILSCRSKHYPGLLIIATEPSQSDDHLRNACAIPTWRRVAGDGAERSQDLTYKKRSQENSGV